MSCSFWDNSACEGTPYCPPRCPRFLDEEGVPLLVRPFEPADFESLGLPPRTRTHLEDWLTDLTSDGWNLLAVRDDRVDGHVGVAPATATVPKFVIFVHQDFRGRGVGTELLNHLVAYANDRDHDAVRLDVSRGNRRAIAVYRNVGFDVLKRMAGELEMELSLQEPIADRVQRPLARRD